MKDRDLYSTSGGATGDEASLDRTIDRLVDGELAPEDYRRALARLDDHADGWRRCALAFLESQALTLEIRQARTDWEFEETNRRSFAVSQPSNEREGPLSVFRVNRTRRAIGLLITTAASFGLALAVGLSVRDYLAGSRQLREPVAAIAESPAQPEATANAPQNGQASPATEALKPDVVFREPRPSGEYLFAVDDAVGPRQFELPIYDGRDLSESELAAWIAKSEPRETSRLIDLIRQAGHGVRTRRALAPIDLQNGEQAFAPALEVEITPVGRQIQ